MLYPPYFVDSSLRAAALEEDKSRVLELDLSESEDLQCKNLMCEKFDFENTQACVCKLARYLQVNRFNNLRVLNLSNNKIDTIPAQASPSASVSNDGSFFIFSFRSSSWML